MECIAIVTDVVACVLNADLRQGERESGGVGSTRFHSWKGKRKRAHELATDLDSLSGVASAAGAEATASAWASITIRLAVAAVRAPAAAIVRAAAVAVSAWEVWGSIRVFNEL